ncbi:MAG: DNA-3-methyladenine glycosylase family protein [Anaerorhabdus sp.]
MDVFEYGEKEIAYLKKVDPILKEWIKEVGYIEREVTPNIYESLVESIVSQQISLQAQKTILQRLKKKVKNIRPKNVDELSFEELKSVGLSERKTEYIKELTQKFLSKEIVGAKLRKKSDQEIIETLIKLRGVGKWTAEMTLLFSLQRTDILSYDDLGIRRGICLLYGLKSVSKEEFEVYRKRFSPYASVASFYLWEKR